MHSPHEVPPPTSLHSLLRKIKAKRTIVRCQGQPTEETRKEIDCAMVNYLESRDPRDHMTRRPLGVVHPSMLTKGVVSIPETMEWIREKNAQLIGVPFRLSMILFRTAEGATLSSFLYLTASLWCNRHTVSHHSHRVWRHRATDGRN